MMTLITPKKYFYLYRKGNNFQAKAQIFKENQERTRKT